jgi:hypothetical protein
MQQLGTGYKSRIGVFGSFRYSPRPGERGARARGHDRGIHRGTPKPGTGREPTHGRFAGHGLGTGHRLGTGRGDRRVKRLQMPFGPSIVEISGRRRRLLFFSVRVPDASILERSNSPG